MALTTHQVSKIDAVKAELSNSGFAYSVVGCRVFVFLPTMYDVIGEIGVERSGYAGVNSAETVKLREALASICEAMNKAHGWDGSANRQPTVAVKYAGLVSVHLPSLPSAADYSE